MFSQNILPYPDSFCIPSWSSTSCRFIESNDWSSNVPSQAEQKIYLLTMGTAGRPSEDSDILGIYEDLAAMDPRESCDDPVSKYLLFLHVELEGLGLCQRIDFSKRTRIHQRLNSLPARQLPLPYGPQDDLQPPPSRDRFSLSSSSASSSSQGFQGSIPLTCSPLFEKYENSYLT